MRNFWIIALGSILACCSGNVGDSEFVPSVYVESPECASSPSVRTFSGIVEEAHEISLGFKTAGQIQKIYVKEGDMVTAGQLLAALDDTDYRLGVEALQIQYDQVSDEVSRARRLYEKKSMSANDYEKASAGLRQLAVQLQANKNKLEYTRLYSPVSGIVQSVNFSPAEMVDAGTALFTLLDVSHMEVVADIPAVSYLEKDSFSEIVCTSAHTADTPCPMRLLSIVPKADGNQLYRMRLAFDNGSAAKFTPGMNVSVKMNLNAGSDTIFHLPMSAVFRSGDADCVWVLNQDSTVTARPVTLDRALSGKKAVVTAGIDAGEQVVRAGVKALHEGQKVKVIEQPEATNVGGLL